MLKADARSSNRALVVVTRQGGATRRRPRLRWGLSCALDLPRCSDRRSARATSPRRSVAAATRHLWLDQPQPEKALDTAGQCWLRTQAIAGPDFSR